MGPSPAMLARLLVVISAGSAIWAGRPSRAVAAPETPPQSTPVSAADKATARDAATQGIQAYREGRHAEALDLMKRAQALYDAPVHQHYIARSQRELGLWVEAAEGFRALSRRSLAEDAPPQWHEAVAEAGRELAELEPRIPRLLIRVEPEAVAGPRLSIDDAAVPSAVLGIERLANPGEHRIEVSADGYQSAEVVAEARPGERTEVEVVLVPLAATATRADPSAADGSVLDAAADAPAPTASRYAVLIGLRLGGALPGGKVPESFARPVGQDGATVNLTEVAGAGGSLELRAGISGPVSFGFLQRWGAHLFVSGGSLANKELDVPGTPAFRPLADAGAEVTTQPAFVSGGLAASLAHPRDRLGVFFELGIVAHALTFEYTTSGNVAGCQEPATARRTGSGAGLRAGAGLGVPISHWGLLTPYLSLSIEPMNTATFSSNGCFAQLYEQAELELPPERQTVDGSATHTFLGLGVGGEVFLGL